MRQIDMQTWPRREHFKVFSAYDQPHGGLCANVDVTAFYPAVKQGDLSLTVAVTYVLARAANGIPEFRYRIRGENVVEHEVVHPSITLLADDDLFTFCTFEYREAFPEFAELAAERIAYARENRTLEDEPGQDDLLFMTAVPWVSFTSVMHPVHLQPPGSVPMFAWGKIFQDGESLKMPLDVQGHHALIDGIHIGRYFAAVQDYLDRPVSVLGVE